MSVSKKRQITALQAFLLIITFGLVGPAILPVLAEESPVLEEIVVTATLRKENLREIPIAVTVLSKELIRDIGAKDFADIARFVPGLDFTDRGSGQNRITVRGVSPDDGVQTVGMYIDEIPTNAATGEQFDVKLFDIASVEVLRGPQGTLYGEGSMGGTVRVLTAKPNAQKMEGNFAAGYSSVGDGGDGFNVNAMINLPIIEDKLALRIVGFTGDEPGYIDNVLLGEDNVNKEKSSGGRATATWFATDKLTITGTVLMQDVEAKGRQLATSTAGLRKLEQSFFVPERRDDEFTISNIVINYQLPWADFISSTSYYERDTQRSVSPFSPATLAILEVFTAGAQPSIPTVFDEDYSAIVQEFRLVSNGDGPLQWVAGVFYKDYDDDITSDLQVFDALLAGVFGAPPLGIAFADRNFQQAAVYGSVTWSITDKLDIGFGGRYFEEDQKNVNGTVDPITGVKTTTPPIRDESFSAFVPRVTIDYEFNEHINLYALYAEGFRSGGVNGNPGGGIPATFDSDKVKSYEIGFKSVFADGRIRLDTAVFYNDWSDLQVTDIDPVGGVLAFTSNAGEAHTAGVEVEMTAMPVEGLTLRFAGNYTEAELDEDVPAAGALKGDRLQSVPKVSFSASGDYRWPLGAIGGGNLEGMVRADYQYVGNSMSDFANATAFKLPAYELTNLRIGVESDRWQLHLFVDNVTNEVAILAFQPDGLGPAFGAAPENFIFRNRPRTVGINFSTSF